MRILHSLLLSLLATAAAAQDAAPSRAVDALRPSGPVTVTADQAEWQDGGLMRYSGNVALVSDTLQLSGELLELRQFPDGQYQASIRGTPARLNHAAAQDKEGKPLPPVSAEARQLQYDSRTGVVQIDGDARMARGGDEINGDAIRYNVAERRIQAAGGSGGQVKIIIQAPENRAAETSGKP